MTERKIGALWAKKGAKGDYFSGELIINGKTVPIVVFKNDRQEGKQPDWHILLSVEKQGLIINED
jgi:hypothetical protein